jgi:Zn-dependent protease
MFDHDLSYYICLIPVILLSLAFHEFSHAFVSNKLGDPTARNAGRLTLNPIRHLDPLGTLMIILSSLQGFGFGWAKPVPISPRYYRNPRSGTILVSLAGPLSNLLLAFIFALPYFFYTEAWVPGELTNTMLNFHKSLFQLSSFGLFINLSLAVFNFIPVPPLDGSKILSGFLPSKYCFKMMQYENYIGLIFLAIILIRPGIISAILGPVVNFLVSIFKIIIVPIVSLL